MVVEVVIGEAAVNLDVLGDVLDGKVVNEEVAAGMVVFVVLISKCVQRRLN